MKGNKGGSGAVGMEDMLILRDHDNHIMVVYNYHHIVFFTLLVILFRKFVEIILIWHEKVHKNQPKRIIVIHVYSIEYFKA